MVFPPAPYGLPSLVMTLTMIHYDPSHLTPLRRYDTHDIMMLTTFIPFSYDIVLAAVVRLILSRLYTYQKPVEYSCTVARKYIGTTTANVMLNLTIYLLYASQPLSDLKHLLNLRG